jgi:ABC-type Mn2+/Zn2+ transport system permease subunit
MHDHNETLFNSSSLVSFNSMSLMWVLMAIMTVHHFFMWKEMKKMKKKAQCDC